MICTGIHNYKYLSSLLEKVQNCFKLLPISRQYWLITHLFLGIAKSLELFLGELITKSVEIGNQGNCSKLIPSHL